MSHTAELIAVGTELLLGNIANTNAQVLSQSLSALGVKAGSVFGIRCKSRAELAGGVVLILMGTKILLEHLGFLG